MTNDKVGKRPIPMPKAFLIEIECTSAARLVEALSAMVKENERTVGSFYLLTENGASLASQYTARHLEPIRVLSDWIAFGLRECRKMHPEFQNKHTEPIAAVIQGESMVEHKEKTVKDGIVVGSIGILISVCGEASKVTVSSLQDVYDAIKCETIESVALGDGADMFVDENGVTKELDQNHFASVVGMGCVGRPMMLVGNALILGRDGCDSSSAPEWVVKFVEAIHKEAGEPNAS